MTITQRTTFDTGALTRAIEARDADAIVARYDSDAVLTVLDRDHPPSAPLTLRGDEEIAAYYRDVCGRNVEHHVSGIVTDGAELAFQQDCRYPDGGRVVCVTVAHLADGRIVGQTVVQAWDE
jgi:hypothetical protein